VIDVEIRWGMRTRAIRRRRGVKFANVIQRGAPRMVNNYLKFKI
jgi:hypothetical protein